jgi:hypothetical protein
MTHHNQTNELTTWILNLPLDESIDNKGTKFEVRIQRLHEAHLNDQKPMKCSRRSSRRRKIIKANKRHEKRQNHENSKKTQNQSQSSKSTLPLKQTPLNTLNASSSP